MEQNIHSMIKLTVPVGMPPQRLSAFLRAAGLSQALRRRIKREATCSVNGLPALWEQFVAAGDTVLIRFPPPAHIPPAPLPLCLVYEDEAVLVIDKPAGLLVHPAAGERTHTMANGVIHYLMISRQPPAFHPVYRLDKNTSGLVVVAKNPLAQHRLSAAGSITRRYLAVVEGVITSQAGTIDLPIARRPGSIIERTVAPDGQRAVTHFTVQERLSRATVLAVTLATGRTHQIRVHLSHVGHPLCGDTLYGRPSPYIARQALHAHYLAFSHPLTGQPLTFTSPLPADIRRLLDALGRKSGSAACPVRRECDILLV